MKPKEYISTVSIFSFGCGGGGLLEEQPPLLHLSASVTVLSPQDLIIIEERRS